MISVINQGVSLIFPNNWLLKQKKIAWVITNNANIIRPT